MLGAGQRNQRVRFERRAEMVKSPSGNLLDEWVTVKECWAGFRPRFGREQLESGQLESGLLGVLTVLRFTETASVTAADRVVFIAGAYKGRVCQIRSIVPTPDNAEFEMLLEDGVVT